MSTFESEENSSQIDDEFSDDSYLNEVFSIDSDYEIDIESISDEEYLNKDLNDVLERRDSL